MELGLDGASELIPVDEQPEDQIVHPLRLRKAARPAHQPLDPRPQVAGFALDARQVFFANCMRCCCHMAFVGAPAVCIIPGNAKRRPLNIAVLI